MQVTADLEAVPVQQQDQEEALSSSLCGAEPPAPNHAMGHAATLQQENFFHAMADPTSAAAPSESSSRHNRQGKTGCKS